ncbi:MAG TPA: hypothetical protein DCK98_15820 [Chloroflexi bacterium]|jgi:transcriptional regulator with XRE-family HTH domain|nr:hypothetical protein [Chloroflexota bacterium]HAL25621.1 hypothetical protein [Chloroflexota bacterium]
MKRITTRSDFAFELRRRRTDRGLTQLELAVAAGVDPATIGNIEARRVTPHRLTWAALMAVVGAPEEDGTPPVPSSWRAQRRARE